jgi:predicted ester cyclase
MKKILAITTLAAILIVLGSASGQTAGAQQATPAATAGGTMSACASVANNPVAGSTEANKALVCRFYDEIFNKKNLNVVDELVAPNYKRYLSPIAAPLDAAGQKTRLAGMLAAFPDSHLTIEDLVAEGDRVAIRLTNRGSHQGAYLGIQPTGKQVVADAIEIMRIENGKIVEHWGAPNNYSLLQQLGATIK